MRFTPNDKPNLTDHSYYTALVSAQVWRLPLLPDPHSEASPSPEHSFSGCTPAGLQARRISTASDAHYSPGSSSQCVPYKPTIHDILRPPSLARHNAVAYRMPRSSPGSPVSVDRRSDRSIDTARIGNLTFGRGRLYFAPSPLPPSPLGSYTSASQPSP